MAGPVYVTRYYRARYKGRRSRRLTLRPSQEDTHVEGSRTG
jgi:hypothetical protein